MCSKFICIKFKSFFVLITRIVKDSIVTTIAKMRRVIRGAKIF